MDEDAGVCWGGVIGGGGGGGGGEEFDSAGFGVEFEGAGDAGGVFLLGVFDAGDLGVEGAGDEGAEKGGVGVLRV